MSPQVLVNVAWAVTLWGAAAATAVVLLAKAAAVVRRNVCRLGLAGVPAVLAGAVVGTLWRPSAGLIVQAPAAAPAVSERVRKPALPWHGHLARGTHGQDAHATFSNAVAPVAEPDERLGPPTVPAPAATVSNAPSGASFTIDWPAAVFAGTGAFAAALTFLLAWRLVRLAAWRRSWQPASSAWVSVTRRLARRVGMERPFAVFLVPGLTQPAATGVFRPAIVLPDRAPASLGPVLRSALAHELGHLAGRDPLWNVLGRAIVAMAWWCPPAWWLRRRAEIESELAADDHALASGVRPIELAKTLARFAELGLRRAPAGVSGMACHLQRRIEMMLRHGQTHRPRAAGREYWLLMAAAGLMGVAILATPLVGVARAEEGNAELKRPPAVRDGGGEGERRVEERREGERPREVRRDGEGERPREVRRDGEGERPREVRRDGEGEGRREGPREGEARFRMPRELQQMMQAAKITNQQEQDIKKALQAKEEAIGEWRRQNAARFREAEEAMRRAQETLRRLRDEQAEVASKADEKVLAVFTPQQRAQGATSRIAAMYNRPNGENPVRMTNRQLDDMDILCEKAQKELIEAEKKPGAAAAQAKEEVLSRLQKEIYEKVLDDEQRQRSPRPRGVTGAREGEGEGRRVERREGEREGPRVPVREGAREGGAREGGEREAPRREGRDADRER